MREVVGWGADARAVERLAWVRQHPSPRWGWRERGRVRRPARVGDVGEEEAAAAAARRRTAAAALGRFLGEEVAPEETPCVAMAFTGGGVRAMVHMLGVLLAAEEAGLLGCVTYTSALSGSAWLQALWMQEPGAPGPALERLRLRLRRAMTVHPLLLAGPEPPLPRDDDIGVVGVGGVGGVVVGGSGAAAEPAAAAAAAAALASPRGGNAAGLGAADPALKPLPPVPPAEAADRTNGSNAAEADAPQHVPVAEPAQSPAAVVVAATAVHGQRPSPSRERRSLGGAVEEEGLGFRIGQSLVQLHQELQESGGLEALEGLGAELERTLAGALGEDGAGDAGALHGAVGRGIGEAVAEAGARRGAVEELGAAVQSWGAWQSQAGAAGGLSGGGGLSLVELYGLLMALAWLPPPRGARGPTPPRGARRGAPTPPRARA